MRTFLIAIALALMSCLASSSAFANANEDSTCAIDSPNDAPLMDALLEQATALPVASADQSEICAPEFSHERGEIVGEPTRPIDSANRKICSTQTAHRLNELSMDNQRVTSQEAIPRAPKRTLN